MQNNNKNFIPDGWEVKRLGDLCETFSGGTPSKSCPDYWENGDIKWLSAKYIEDNKVLGYDFITESGLKNSSAKMSKVGDIILVTRVSVGKFLLCEEPFAVNQDLTVIRPKNSDVKFIFYALYSKKSEIIDKSQGLAIKGITKDNLNNIEIFCPKLAEQEGIAGVLGDWDNTLELLDKQIELKAQQKKALMQTLLTGNARLPGFTTPWHEIKLGDVFQIKKGEQLSKLNMLESGEYPVLNGGQDFSGYTDSYNTEKNTITISEGGNSCGFVNYMTSEFWCGGHCYTVETEINKPFSYHILKFNESNIMKLRVGSGLPNIQKSTLEKFKLSIPKDIAEQNAIADVLTAADDEIAFLQQRRELVAQQKKYLMQTLLTGQIRIPLNNQTNQKRGELK